MMVRLVSALLVGGSLLLPLPVMAAWTDAPVPEKAAPKKAAPAKPTKKDNAKSKEQKAVPPQLPPERSPYQTLDGPKTYAHCLALAKQKPELGWEEALAWQGLGGGEAARHCAAIALIGLEKYGEAATRLETLANESVREDSLRAEMFAQAAQAWAMEEGQMGRADTAMAAARTVDPNNLDLMIDQAVLWADMGRYVQAEEVLSTLLRRQPNRIEALVLRASARRYQNDLDGAWADIERAVQLDPQFAEGLVEHGIIQRLRGNDAAARADWMNAFNLDPKGPAGELARQNLDLLDTGQ